MPSKRHNKVPGFTDIERRGFDNILKAGFTDIFRSRNPDQIAYTFWTYKFQSRQKNNGWRLDYWVASKDMVPKLGPDFIRSSVYGDKGGSDHCPIGILLNTSKDE